VAGKHLSSLYNKNVPSSLFLNLGSRTFPAAPSKTDKLSTYSIAVGEGACCGNTPKGYFTLLICSIVQARLPSRDAAVHVRQVIQAVCLACADRDIRNITFPAVGSKDNDMFANFC